MWDGNRREMEQESRSGVTGYKGREGVEQRRKGDGKESRVGLGKWVRDGDEEEGLEGSWARERKEQSKKVCGSLTAGLNFF